MRKETRKIHEFEVFYKDMSIGFVDAINTKEARKLMKLKWPDLNYLTIYRNDRRG